MSNIFFSNHWKRLSICSRILMICLSLIIVNSDAQRREMSNDTTSILLLADRAYQLYGSKPDSSLYYATQANKLATQIEFDKGRGKALRVIGIYYFTQSDYFKALDFFEQALVYSKNANDKKNIAGCFGNMGVVYRTIGNYEKAIENQLHSLQIREEIHDTKGKATGYNNIAVIYWEMGDNEKTLEYFFKSLDILKSLNDQLGIASTYENIGRIYQEQNKLSESLTFQLDAINIQEEIDDKRGLLISYVNLADLFLALQQLDKVLPTLEKAENIITIFPSPDRLSIIRKIQAKYYNAINRPDKAYQLINESQEIARQVRNREAYREATWEKYKIAFGLNNFKDALENYELFIALRDSLNNEKANRRLASREYALKEAQLLVEQEKKELEFQKTQDIQKKIMYAIGGVMIIFVIASIFIYRFITLRNRASQLKIRSDFEMQLSKMRLKALQSQMNPHFIFNCLNSINHFILGSRPAEASDYLAKFSKLIRLFMEEISDNMCTLAKEYLTLKLYLELEKLRFGEKLSFHIDVDRDMAMEEIFIPPMIIQPFVENAIIHGIQPLKGNGLISIRFFKDIKGVNCIVEDNGVGRRNLSDPYSEITRKSYGTNLCNQRLALLQPKSTIQIHDLRDLDGHAKGTKVHITFISETIF